MTGTAHGGHSRHVSFERERGVYQILVTPDLAHVVVTVGADSERGGRVLRVFRTLADENIPLFLIKLHRTAVSFAIESAHVPRLQACLQGVASDCTVRPDLVLLTILASSMRDLTGVMVSIAD